MKVIYPVVDQNRPIRKTQAQDRYSWPIIAACLKKNYHWSPREKTNSFCLHNGICIFLKQLNNLHQALQFIFDKEENDSIVEKWWTGSDGLAIATWALSTS